MTLLLLLLLLSLNTSGYTTGVYVHVDTTYTCISVKLVEMYGTSPQNKFISSIHLNVLVQPILICL